jgi:tetratricopeptide (TPR) repeat protein
MTGGEDDSALLKRAFDLHTAGDFAAALDIYEALLDDAPDHPDALRLAASARRSSGDLTGALALFEKLTAAETVQPEVWFNYGNALADAGRFEDSIAAYQKTIAAGNAAAEVYANLGIAEVGRGDHHAAIAAYHTALGLDPRHKTAMHNLGNALVETGDLDAGIDMLRRTVAAYPELAEARYNLALALLRAGDFSAGFRQYEWRWRTEKFPARPRYTEIADWNGRPYPGKTLLVHAEQGLGDTIQFVKLLPLARSLVGRLVLQVPDKLVRLLSRVQGFDSIVGESEDPGSIDLQSPLLGLPHRLQLTPGSIPAARFHLTAEPERVLHWRKTLQLDGGAKALGFVWKGNPYSPVERGRSLAGPRELAPFANLPDVRLIALQKLAPGMLERADTPSGWKVGGLDFVLEHPGPDFDAGADAFVDTAGIMANLAGVVSVCTAPLHLAGALGVPSVALLKAAADWRWMRDRDDTPWYPSMTLCRQTRPGDFASAIAAAVDVVAKDWLSAQR